jgi:hypothetical protein
VGRGNGIVQRIPQVHPQSLCRRRAGFDPVPARMTSNRIMVRPA